MSEQEPGQWRPHASVPDHHIRGDGLDSRRVAQRRDRRRGDGAGQTLSGIVGIDEGTGATLQAAESQAFMYLHGDYYGCRPPAIYYGYGQYANGTWYAWVEEDCGGYI
jgi:hypothetical protein